MIKNDKSVEKFFQSSKSNVLLGMILSEMISVPSIRNTLLEHRPH